MDANVIQFLMDRVAADQIPAWIQWCRERIHPASVYLGNQEVKHEAAVRIASSASMWLPWRFVERNHLRAAVKERLERFGLFQADLVERCLEEMPVYTNLAQGVSDKTDLEHFWRAHADKLPGWSAAFLIVGLIQPSSAAAERGFSVFEATFGRGNLPQATEQLMETQMKARVNKDI